MKLYVGNLSSETTKIDLQLAFERFGTVTDATVMRERETDSSCGFGFVTMASQKEAEAAVRGLNEKALQGYNLVIAESRMREERPRRSIATSTCDPIE